MDGMTLSQAEATALRHTDSCPQRIMASGEKCSCGLEWRDALETEKTMHAAWRKRAEEAESKLRRSVDELEVRKSVEGMEARRFEHGYGTPQDRLTQLLNSMRQRELDAIAGCKAFRDDCVNWLRAISMIVESVGNASTHGEKAARCRGAVELVESAIEKLRRRNFDSPHSWQFWMDDCFRSDYPTREYVRRIHELEAELKELRLSHPADPVAVAANTSIVEAF